MKRKIIEIDNSKCTGCGLCAEACHEGAIEMVNGKAKLMREDFCDGFGDCLPACPAGAITFTEKEAPDYNEEEVRKHKMKKHFGSECPGKKMMNIKRENRPSREVSADSELVNWPCQIKLAPLTAPYFEKAKLLIAADCAAYAYAAMHDEFMKGRTTLIGCPKLDNIDYSEKLTEIIRGNEIESLTVVKMEVPCCEGIANAAKKALRESGKFIPWNIVTISISGEILER